MAKDTVYRNSKGEEYRREPAMSPGRAMARTAELLVKKIGPSKDINKERTAASIRARQRQFSDDSNP